MIATADIRRIKEGALADYEVELREDLLGGVGDTVVVHDYPRLSVSVWDLFARSAAAALNAGREALPPRPTRPNVPVHVRSTDGVRYVRLDQIGEPTRTFLSIALPDRRFRLMDVRMRTIGWTFWMATDNALRK
ncbi:hypothetical protein [Burkholderia sp. PU8-34]